MASDALHVSRTQDEEPLSASGQERPWVLRVRPVDGLPFVDDVRAHPLAAPDEQAKRVSGRIVVLRDGDDVFGRRDPRDAGEVRVDARLVVRPQFESGTRRVAIAVQVDEELEPRRNVVRPEDQQRECRRARVR